MKRFEVRRLSLPAPCGRMRALLATPKGGGNGARVGLLWLHGGGYLCGMASMLFASRALPLVKKYGAVVLAPAYRQSWRAPYPAALEDAYSALCYLWQHAEELGVDPARIMVGGESAGGGLAAALCQLARERGGPKICFQFPLYPMLDDRDTPSSRRNFAFPWNTLLNHACWRLYLRGVKGEVPPFAAPARQQNLLGLPPAYSFVGRGEPFYCETMEYIHRLQQAGVAAAVDVYPTSFHAFDMLLPFRWISRQAAARFEQQFLRAAVESFAGENNQEKNVEKT